MFIMVRSEDLIVQEGEVFPPKSSFQEIDPSNPKSSFQEIDPSTPKSSFQEFSWNYRYR